MKKLTVISSFSVYTFMTLRAFLLRMIRWNVPKRGWECRGEPFWICWFLMSWQYSKVPNYFTLYNPDLASFPQNTYLDVLSRPLDGMPEPSVYLWVLVCLTIMKFLPEFSKTTRMAVFLDLFPGDQIAALSWNGTLVVMRHIVYGHIIFIIQCCLFYYLSFLLPSYPYILIRGQVHLCLS